MTTTPAHADATTTPKERFTAANPCPVCAGYDSMPRGQRKRCHGFLSTDGFYARCSREEFAAGLPSEAAGTYAHRLDGPCRCGASHTPRVSTNGQHASRLGRIVATYAYCDESGTLLFEVLRYDPKAFKVRRPDGSGGWVWTLNGTTRVLYQLPALLAASAAEPVYLCEGEKAVDALRGAGVTATCSPGGAGKWRSEYVPFFAGRNVVILPDNDDPGRAHAQQVAASLAGVAASVKIVALPDLPPKGDVCDSLDAGYSREELERLATAAPEWAAPGDEASASPPAPDWPARRPIPTAPPVPTLPPELVPAPFRAWLVEAAARACLPLDLLATPAIVAFGGFVGRAVGIRPWRFDDYVVVPNLWGAIVARPGLLKTYVIDEGCSPSVRLEATARERFAAESARASARLDRLQAEIDALRDQMKAAAKKGVSLEAMEAELAVKKGELAEAAPVQRRYITNDATPEKLQQLLQQNPRGLLAKRDELTAIFASFDRQGREGEREFYLEAWNGTGSFTVDRIGRGTTHIAAITLGLFGGLQPGKLLFHVRQSTAGGDGDDGLIQRLQLLVWPDSLPAWRQPDRWPDREGRNAATAVFEHYDGEIAALVGATRPDGGGIAYLRFDAEAQQLADAWRDVLERRLRSDELASSPAFAAHISKYRSLFPSLALLFQLLDDAAGTPAGAVTLPAARLAAAWCDFLEAHARKVYAEELTPGYAAAEALAERIIAGDVTDGDPVRDLYRKGWSRLGTVDRVDAALTVLEAAGWLRVITTETGGRPGRIVALHPDFREVTNG